jgi:hypothetical protein
VRWRRRRHLDLILALVARGGSVLGDVACPVGWLVAGRAAYKELLFGPARVAREERLEPSSGEVCIVAAVEARPARGIPSGLLRRADGVLRWRHMAVSARLIAAKGHVALAGAESCALHEARGVVRDGSDRTRRGGLSFCPGSELLLQRSRGSKMAQ